MLWPLILHVKGPYCILVLPLVEAKHVKAYERLYKRSDCGTAIGMDPNLSSLLLDLPSITGYGMLPAEIIMVLLQATLSSGFIVSSPYFCFV